ncbi:MAG: sulfite exporter TauE/SafE family protein [Halioglobus sp.]
MGLVTELLPLALVMLLTGALGGVLAGLLGVGGGIVIVPVLDTSLGMLDVDPSIRMHIAVATSLATIIPTSISSSRAHHAKGAVDFDLVRYWGPFVFIGSVIGTLLAAQVEGEVLSIIFGTVALLVAIKMLLPLEGVHLSDDIPRGALGSVTPLGIGTLSSMMGIGGGTLSVPVLTLMNQAIHKAVGTAALFGLLISLPGALGYVYAGWGDARLPPGSVGYVNLIGLLLISPVTVMAAPLGAKIAHKLNKRQLSLAFGVFLLMVSLRMLFRALA